MEKRHKNSIFVPVRMDAGTAREGPGEWEGAEGEWGARVSIDGDFQGATDGTHTTLTKNCWCPSLLTTG